MKVDKGFNIYNSTVFTLNLLIEQVGKWKQNEKLDATKNYVIILAWNCSFMPGVRGM